jgi:hypothetical protein
MFPFFFNHPLHGNVWLKTCRLLGGAKGYNKQQERWGVGNRVHCVRDVAFGEDSRAVSSGNAPPFFVAFHGG